MHALDGSACYFEKLGVCPQISSESYVNRLEVTYQVADGSFVERKHGGSGGKPQESFALTPDEYINAMSGRFGDIMDQLSFKTNAGRVYGPFGGEGGMPFTFDAPGRARGFHGSTGDFADSGEMLKRICMDYIT